MTEVHSWYQTGLVRQKPGTYNLFRVIHCSFEISAWIMEQDPTDWIYIPMQTKDLLPGYWVSERLIIFLNLKFASTYLPEL